MAKQAKHMEFETEKEILCYPILEIIVHKMQ
jgi:hypothetical protein